MSRSGLKANVVGKILQSHEENVPFPFWLLICIFKFGSAFTQRSGVLAVGCLLSAVC